MEAVDSLVSLRQQVFYNKTDEATKQNYCKPASEQPLPPSATKAPQPANPAKYVSHSPAVVHHHVATTQVTKAQVSSQNDVAKKKSMTTVPSQIAQPNVAAVVNNNQTSSIIKLAKTHFTNPKLLLPGSVAQPTNVLNLSKSASKQNEVKIYMMNKEVFF